MTSEPDSVPPDGIDTDRKPLIFVGGPFTQLLDPTTGLVDEQHRKNYTAVMAHLSDRGFEVENAHRREGWGARLMAPDECTPADYLTLRSAVLFIAYPGNPVSPGTMVELGWMSAMAKPTILLVERGSLLPPLVAGLHTVAPVRYLEVIDGQFNPRSLDACLSQLLGTLPPAIDRMNGRSAAAVIKPVEQAVL